MSTENKKNRHLLQTFRLYIILLAIALAVLIAFTSVFLSLYYTTNQTIYIILLTIGFSLIFIGFIVLSILIVRRVHMTYYNQLFKVTYENIKKLDANDTNFEPYNDLNIEEIDNLNNMMVNLKKKFDGAYLIVKDNDYSVLNLEYEDKEQGLLTYSSFKNNLGNLVFMSQSFRNVIIEVYYSFNNGSLEKEDRNRILRLYKRVFADYKSSLFALGEDGNSIIIYLPIIDSFSKIMEQLENNIDDSSVIIRTANGYVNIPARFAVVSYPYSGEEYLLSDLRYAKRQQKVINLFLPTRTKNNIGQQVLMNTSMNLNYMGKIISSLAMLESEDVSDESAKKSIVNLLNDLSNYLDIDNAGIILYDQNDRKYRPFLMSDRSLLFKKANQVGDNVVEALFKATDDNNSYYFSTRSHANNELGRTLDYYGVSSGYFYVVRGNGKVGSNRAILYFFNTNGKNFEIDTYLRETLFIISLRIKHYFEQKGIVDFVDLLSSENEYILSMSNRMICKTDDDFHITYMSNDFKKIHKNAKVGDLCYQSLYGLDKPCHDCPNKTFKKKYFKYKDDEYEVSLSLNERKQHNRALLITKLSKEESQDVTHGDLFNKDFLTYSYLSLYEELRDEYASGGRGYVLLLSIDNSDVFLSSQGSEGYLYGVRALIRNLKNKLKTNDIYMYNPTTIAISFPFIGHADVIAKCETIFDVSKEHYFDDNSSDQFKITYLPLGYPRGYANADDFMKHVSDFYRSPNYERNKDFIYFADHSITRSASKREFMISVIESEFSGHKSQSVNLQPLVSAKTRQIFGAEILLRINDVYRNAVFNAEEISRIAEQENKTHLITDSLINFVGDMYKEYGKSVFKINDFNRIAINIDTTYLNDINLLKGVIELSEANKLPKNFISFEIPEDIIPDNIDRIKAFNKELASHHIFISVDRFTGEYVGGEQLKELGFNEIKISRNLISKIDKDPIRLKEVGDIIANAHKVGISVAAVGVENEAQFNALKNFDPEIIVQGYYFYKPLGRSELISAIVSYNK